MGYVTVTGKPFRRFRRDIIVNEINKTVLAEAEIVKREYERTVRTWSDKPQFVIIPARVTKSQRYIDYSVGTDNVIYMWTDDGTKPHRIEPKAPGYPLRFNSQFGPKTAPRVIGSKSGFSKPPEVRAYAVNHPGTDAREFTKEIAKRSEKRIRRKLPKAVEKALAKVIKAK